MVGHLSRLALAAACLLTAGTASAVTVTFDGIAGGNNAAPSYSESGFTFTSIQGNFFGFPTAGQLHLDPGGFGNAIYDVTFGGGAFSVQSVDVSYASSNALLNVDAYDPSNSFIGSIAFDVSSTGTLVNPFPTFQFGRLRITDTGNHFSLDNLVASGVSGVPEPATWAMMIGGFGLTGGMMRRRRQAALPARA